MKITLNMRERLTLLNLLPIESHILVMKMLRKVKEELGFNDIEIRRHRIKMNNETGHVTWSGDCRRELDIPNAIRDLVVERLKDFEKEGKIRDEHIDLWDKFVLGDNDETSDSDNGES